MRSWTMFRLNVELMGTVDPKNQHNLSNGRGYASMRSQNADVMHEIVWGQLLR